MLVGVVDDAVDEDDGDEDEDDEDDEDEDEDEDDEEDEGEDDDEFEEADVFAASEEELDCGLLVEACAGVVVLEACVVDEPVGSESAGPVGPWMVGSAIVGPPMGGSTLAAMR